MSGFDSNSYGEAVAELLVDLPLNELGPGSENQDAHDRLAALDSDAIFTDNSVTDDDMADCCRSAIWLRHDFLDASHTISQQVETADGSYWHGIMHRREPDFSNSKYWFRRVGDHEISPQLARSAGAIIGAAPENGLTHEFTGVDWDPFHFVDLCERYQHGPEVENRLCRQIALAEWEILFDYCYQQAIGQ